MAIVLKLNLNLGVGGSAAEESPALQAAAPTWAVSAWRLQVPWERSKR